MYINEQPILKELSLRYGLDMRVITQIVQSPFKFAKSKITSDDERPIRIRYFAVFHQKKKPNKRTAAEKNLKTILRLSESTLPRILGISWDECKIELNRMIKDGEFNKIEVLNCQCRRLYKSDMKDIS